jgi:ankyrin repeat protein
VDFTIPNYAGNTPLSHAVAFGRDDVVQWLLEDPSLQVTREDEVMALSLAQDFVQWTKGSDKGRTKVLNLFIQEDDDTDDADELIDTMDGFLL